MKPIGPNEHELIRMISAVDDATAKTMGVGRIYHQFSKEWRRSTSIWFAITNLNFKSFTGLEFSEINLALHCLQCMAEDRATKIAHWMDEPTTDWKGTKSSIAVEIADQFGVPLEEATEGVRQYFRKRGAPNFAGPESMKHAEEFRQTPSSKAIANRYESHQSPQAEIWRIEKQRARCNAFLHECVEDNNDILGGTKLAIAEFTRLRRIHQRQARRTKQSNGHKSSPMRKSPEQSR